ncbi:thioredoxin family protein [Oceanobacillus senegalensis]|uniref:thioredoxin family protein n=1 Tax=Oceanobacillus senegalensis TaxID=1936063 RepID=UPI000A307952|nr:thioredoxin family protein [Oceanobacillus senegalensis]
MKKAVFYHAGCPVCVDAEKMMLGYLDQSKVDLEIVHFGEDASRIKEAESAGVKSVPALVVDGQTYHINYGASMEDVKNG